MRRSGCPRRDPASAAGAEPRRQISGRRPGGARFSRRRDGDRRATAAARRPGAANAACSRREPGERGSSRTRHPRLQPRERLQLVAGLPRRRRRPGGGRAFGRDGRAGAAAAVASPPRTLRAGSADAWLPGGWSEGVRGARSSPSARGAALIPRFERGFRRARIGGVVCGQDRILKSAVLIGLLQPYPDRLYRSPRNQGKHRRRGAACYWPAEVFCPRCR